MDKNKKKKQDKDYHNFKYDFTFTYNELSNIKTSLGYVINRLHNEKDIKIELIVLRDTIQKRMLEIVKKKRAKNE